jgi:hypothetical protein
MAGNITVNYQKHVLLLKQAHLIDVEHCKKLLSLFWYFPVPKICSNLIILQSKHPFIARPIPDIRYSACASLSVNCIVRILKRNT